MIYVTYGGAVLNSINRFMTCSVYNGVGAYKYFPMQKRA